MKETIETLIDIEPSVYFLDFIGQPKNPNSLELENDQNKQFLRGNIRLHLKKKTRIWSITVKFKGESHVSHSNVTNFTYSSLADYFHQKPELGFLQDENCNDGVISTPILPKLKTKIIPKSINFSEQENLIPWELEIPNIYPRTFRSRYGEIRYWVEVEAVLGITKKHVTSQKIISLRRHLLPSRESAPLVSTKTLENTAPNQFSYSIEVPRTICIEQEYIPISISYDPTRVKEYELNPLKVIYTQIIQAEVYRNRNVSKTEADMTIAASKASAGQQIHDSLKEGDPDLSTFVKRLPPITLNTINSPEKESEGSTPLLLKHDIDTSLIQGIESPLIAIYHQLEVTFYFEQKNSEIHVKIPIRVSTVTGLFTESNDSSSEYSKNTETVTRTKYTMEIQPHSVPSFVEMIDPPSDSTAKVEQGQYDGNKPSKWAARSSTKNVSLDFALKKAISDQKLNKEKSPEFLRSSKRRSTISDALTSSDISLATTLNTSKSSGTIGLLRSAASSNTYSKSSSSTVAIDTDLASKNDSIYSTNENGSDSLSPQILLSPFENISCDNVIKPPPYVLSGLSPPPRISRSRRSTEKGSSGGGSSSSSSEAIDIIPSQQDTLSRSYPPTDEQQLFHSPSSVPPLQSPRSVTSKKFQSIPNKNSLLRLTKRSSSFSNDQQLGSDWYPSSPPPSTPTFINSRKELQQERQQEPKNMPSIFSHYVSADLPPLPPTPGITQQKLPPIPIPDEAIIRKHRCTKMYYEEESNDEEDDEQDDEQDDSSAHDEVLTDSEVC